MAVTRGLSHGHLKCKTELQIFRRARSEHCQLRDELLERELVATDDEAGRAGLGSCGVRAGAREWVRQEARSTMRTRVGVGVGML